MEQLEGDYKKINQNPNRFFSWPSVFQRVPGTHSVGTNQFVLFGNLFLPVRLKLYLSPSAGNRAGAVLDDTRAALCHKEGVLYLGQRLSLASLDIESS